jgi:DNA-binding winged helix-turn-helix (wHTH) protein
VSVRLQFDDITFDPDSRRLWAAGVEVRLSPKAFDLLALLVERRPHAVPKADIRQRLWPGTFVSESSIPSLISELRLAIADHRRKPRLLRTLHAFGYAFEATDGPRNVDAAGAAAPAGWLVSSTAEIPLAAGAHVLGREAPGVIALQSTAISRRHARIVIDAHGARVEDLGSKNGTYVNDRRVEGVTPVIDGDQVRFALLRFTFRLAQPGGSTDTMTSPAVILPP